jgi:hypothetical protein
MSSREKDTTEVDRKCEIGGSLDVDRRERKGKEASTSGSHHRKRKESRVSDRKSRKSKRHRRYRDEDSSTSSSASTSPDETTDTSSEDESGDRRKKKKRKRSHDHNKKKKKYRSKDMEKKEKKSKGQKRSKDTREVDDRPVFGKYGIIKLSDMPTKQRSFEIWLEQVKGIPGFTGPKWELQNYFKEYAEDYNTATLPHIKYYDYDRWEMDEYTRNKKAKMEASSSAASSKEAVFQQEQRDLTRNKQKEGLDLVKSMMNKEKIEEMKRQKQLQSEMAHAFKTGDHQRYQQLKNRLEREK